MGLKVNMQLQIPKSVFLFVGIQQWRLDSDASSSALQKKDEVDSIQCCLNAMPKMKV